MLKFMKCNIIFGRKLLEAWEFAWIIRDGMNLRVGKIFLSNIPNGPPCERADMGRLRAKNE
jgi:hypothetical protein